MIREEALNILHNASVYHPDYLDALNMAIKALEQEQVLDKIREEIKVMTSNRGFLSCSVDYIHEKIDAIFDKYKAESEEE